MQGSDRYRPIAYFGWAFALSWGAWGVSAALARVEGQQPLALLFNLLGLLGPAIAALGFVFGSRDAALARDFKARWVELRRIRPKYLVVTVALPPLVTCLAIAISLFFGGSPDQLRVAEPEKLLPTIVLAMLLAPALEETGWRGYAMDALRAHLGLRSATLAFGTLWLLWHAPLVLIVGTYQYELAHMETPLYIANFFVSVLPAAVLASWLYYAHDRSIMAGVLLHSTLNGAAVLLGATQPTKCIVTLVYVAVAIAILATQRERFAAGAREFIASHP